MEYKQTLLNIEMAYYVEENINNKKNAKEKVSFVNKSVSFPIEKY